MSVRVIFFTQPGCISCELTRIFFEAKGVAAEERDISTDLEARREMIDDHGSTETPTLVFLLENTYEVVVGFDPVRFDELLDPHTSSDSVAES